MQAALAHDEPEIGASFRRAGDSIDCYRIWVDGPVLRIDAKGAWDLQVAEAYCTAITEIIADVRLRCPHLRAIVDRSSGLELDEGVSERLMATYRDSMRGGDRIAIVVNSSLDKARVRRLADREETQAFLSISAARMWLLAYG